MPKREQTSTLLMAVWAFLEAFQSSLLDRKAANDLLITSQGRSSSFDCLRKNLGLCVNQRYRLVERGQTWWHSGQGELKHQIKRVGERASWADFHGRVRHRAHGTGRSGTALLILRILYYL